jgi:hypothetical protein
MFSVYMNNKPMNRFVNQARWLISAARFGVALLLLGTTVEAQIVIQDGTPLTALAGKDIGSVRSLPC